MASYAGYILLGVGFLFLLIGIGMAIGAWAWHKNSNPNTSFTTGQKALLISGIVVAFIGFIMILIGIYLIFAASAVEPTVQQFELQPVKTVTYTTPGPQVIATSVPASPQVIPQQVIVPQPNPVVVQQPVNPVVVQPQPVYQPVYMQ